MRENITIKMMTVNPIIVGVVKRASRFLFTFFLKDFLILVTQYF
jgi:hypothetical protein